MHTLTLRHNGTRYNHVLHEKKLYLVAFMQDRFSIITRFWCTVKVIDFRCKLEKKSLDTINQTIQGLD